MGVTPGSTLLGHAPFAGARPGAPIPFITGIDAAPEAGLDPLALSELQSKCLCRCALTPWVISQGSSSGTGTCDALCAAMKQAQVRQAGRHLTYNLTSSATNMIRSKNPKNPRGPEGGPPKGQSRSKRTTARGPLLEAEHRCWGGRTTAAEWIMPSLHVHHTRGGRHL